MKRTKTNKLFLSRESIRRLDNSQLRGPVGGLSPTIKSLVTVSVVVVSVLKCPDPDPGESWITDSCISYCQSCDGALG